MYTLSYDAPFGMADGAFEPALQATGFRALVSRTLTPGRATALAAFVLVAGTLYMVPWHADQAAGQDLARMLATAPRAIDKTALQLPPATIAAADTATNTTASVTATVAQAPAVAALAPAATPSTPQIEQRTVALGTGQTLAGMLQSLGAVAEEAKAAVAAMGDVMNVRRVKAGQQFQVTMQHDGASRNLLGLTFLAEPTKQITLGRDEAGAFDAKAAKVPTTYQKLAASGTIRGSLFEAASDAGVTRDVTRDMMKMFAYTVDFQRDLQAGDKFQVYYGQDVTANGDKVGNGDIIYATLQIGGKLKQLYRYEYDKGQYDYFDENGKSVKRGLLRTPVDNPHITSGFGVRMHPILGFSKMHTGVDFGAATGAPIYAAGDGVIEQAGWFSDYGKYVKIRHTGKLETAYGHMSTIVASLKPGTRIRQGQLIGYVGSTGRATGPHLHYEVMVNDSKVNPIGVNVDTGRSLDGRQLTAFKTWRQQMQTQYVASLEKPAAPAASVIATAKPASKETRLANVSPLLQRAAQK